MTVPLLILAEADRHPDATAIEDGETRLTYRDLDVRSARLAQRLRVAGLRRGGRVGVHLPRSAEAVVSLLAVLRAGAVYLPLNPDYPLAWRASTIADARLSALVGDADALDGLTESIGLPPLIDVHGDVDDVDAGDWDEEVTAPQGIEDAYVIYTSGTTGAPKGVQVTHANFANHVRAMRDALRLTEADRCLQFASLSFDVSLEEIAVTLASGATLVIRDDALDLAPEAFVEACRVRRISVLNLPTAYWRELVTGRAAEALAELTQVRTAVIGGELADGDLRRAWFAQTSGQVELLNAYAPTECTITCTVARVSPDEAAETIPIGLPIAGSWACILDAVGQPVGAGIVGELYVGGASVARGYLGRPALTAERFVPDPFGPPGARLYRTGDRARRLWDGALDVLGRGDDQVKIRGFRVEPDEISAVLRMHVSVVDAVVAAAPTAAAETELVAFVRVAADSQSDDDVSTWRAFLAQRLPAHMVPTGFVVVDAIPRTVNGKVDRAALLVQASRRAPQRAAAAPLAAHQSRPTASPREDLLAEIFADVLGVPSLDPKASFFEMGGHSLLAVRLANRIRSQLGAEIGIRDVFEAPNVRSLARRVEARRVEADASDRPPLTVGARSARTPLSFAQRRLWFLDQMQGQGVAYHVPLVVRLVGLLDRAALADAVADVVARHEILRTIYRVANDEPYQIVLTPEQSAVSVPVIHVAPDGLRAALHEFCAAPFDIAARPPVRAALIADANQNAGENACVFALVLHHIAFDGWSTSPLADELAAAYRARRAGMRPERAPLALQYADYSLWQRAQFDDIDVQGSAGARQINYWTKALEGLPDEIVLPADRPRPITPMLAGGLVTAVVDDAVHEGLRRVARAYGATLLMTLQAGVAALLTRLGAGTDVPLGAISAGRTDPALDEVIGFFVNTHVLRIDTFGGPAFGTLLRQVRETALAVYDQQDVPFDLLVEAVRPTRSSSRNPLFQVMVTLQSEDGPWLQLPDVTAEPFATKLGTAKFDLSFQFAERAESDTGRAGLELRLVYSTDLFEHDSAARVASQLVRLLAAASAQPERSISELALVDAAERTELLALGSGRQLSVPDMTLHELVGREIAAHPNRPAVRFEGAEISYAELDDRATRLAGTLAEYGAAGSVVAVALDRSIELVVALLAVLRAGAAYLPLEVTAPPARIAGMLADTSPAAIVSEAGREQLLAGWAGPVVLVGDAVNTPAPEPSNVPSAACTPRSDRGSAAAYVLFTSGSTGRPKGVVIPHAGIVNRLLWMQDEYRLGANDRVLQKTPYTFDVSVWEFFWPLIAGATLVLARPGGHLDPFYLARTIQAEQITTVHFVPSMLREFCDVPTAASCTSLRRVLCSGEALAPQTRDRFHDLFASSGVELYNLYGPTEASVDVTYAPCPPNERGQPVPIGVPVANTQVYVLDDTLRLTPRGMRGELYLAGVQLAHGYANRAVLTAERFLPNPFGPPGARMYRTGDVVRWDRRGRLEYLGRQDDQVKIHGIRVEPGEVEHVLTAHPAVSAAAVVVRPFGPDTQALVAHVQIDPAHAPALAALLRATRHGGEPQRWPLPNGARVAARTKSEVDFLHREIFTDNEYGQLGVHVPPDGVVFDVGAHIGMFALFVADQAPGATIYAFEPIPDLFDLLEHNLAANGVRSHAFNIGLSDRPGNAQFTYYPGLSFMSGRFGDLAAERDVVAAFAANDVTGTVSGDARADLSNLIESRLKGVPVNCVLSTVSQVIDETGIAVIDLLKADVEKSELDVLRGIEDRHWDRIRQVALEVHDIDGRVHEICTLLSDRGFRTATSVSGELSGAGLVNVVGLREPIGAPPPPTSPPRPPSAPVLATPADLVAVLFDQLRARLPAHLVPRAIGVVDRLPTTVNGKLDRAALGIPETGPRAEPTEPTDLDMLAVSAVFADALGLQQIGGAEDFFALGGHSLLAIRVVNRLRTQFGVELPVSAIFDAPTPATLAEAIRDAVESVRPALTARERPDSIPLSAGQRRIWFLDQLEPSAAYTIPLVVRLRGALDADALQLALSDLVARHEILRTRYPEKDGVPRQEILEPRDDLILLPVSDLAETDLADALAELSAITFRVATDLPLQARLFRLSVDDHVLAVVVHHIAADSWSSEPFWSDLGLAYQLRSLGHAPRWKPLPVQYADVALWQRGSLGDPDDPHSRFAFERDYWLEALSGLPCRLQLPFDRPHTAASNQPAGRVQVEIDEAMHRALQQLATDGGATLFMALHAAVAAALRRVGAGDDLPIGTTIVGRGSELLDGMIGFFANTLVLRADLTGDPSFRSLLRRVRERDLAAFTHAALPFEQLAEQFAPVGVKAGHPFFDVALLLTGNGEQVPEFAGLDAERVVVDTAITKCDLVFHFRENPADDRPGRLDCALEFDRSVFDLITAERILALLAATLSAVARDPGAPISALDVVDFDDVHRVLSDGTGRWLPVPSGTLVAQFEAVVAHHPDAVALLARGTRLTYAEFDQRANRLARALCRRGAGPGVIIALLLPRGLEHWVAVLATLKSGAAYLAIDAANPPKRVDFLLVDAAPALVIRNTKTRADCCGEVAALVLDEPATIAELAALPGHTLSDAERAAPLRSKDAAYVCYTSGSTGSPKGVVIEHRTAVNLAAGVRDQIGIGPGDRMLQLASVGFDASLFEWCGALLSGAALAIVPAEVLAGPPLADVIGEFGATHAVMTPSVLATLPNPDAAELATLRSIIAGGEVLSAQLAARWAPSRELRNGYGPTEHTVCATLSSPLTGAGPVPLGTPLANTRVYVLDDALQPVPPGGVGEMYLAGAQVTRGYLGRPALTADRFLPDPRGEPGDRMYRTGDQARWSNEGALLFLGRPDDQIKVRAVRIEPGEIAAELALHPEVEQAVVVVRDELSTGPGLIGYITPRLGSQPTGVQVLAWLAARVPSYQKPAAVVVLDQMPCTLSGKLDRHALPTPDLPPSTGRGAASAREAALCLVFAQVLGAERVSAEDGFFDIGGHSLLATHLVQRIQTEVDERMTLGALYRSPTPAGIARLLAASGDAVGNSGAVRWPVSTLLLAGGGSRLPLICVHPVTGLSLCYSGLARWLPDRPIHGFQAIDLDGAVNQPASWDELLDTYLTELRRIQPVGPYLLLGWSLGGNLAHALAARLRSSGESVPLLIMLDSYPADLAGWLKPGGLTTGDVLAMLRREGDGFERDPSLAASLTAAANSLSTLVAAAPVSCFDGDVLFLAARRADAAVWQPQAWAPHVTGRFESQKVAVGHYDMTTPAAMAQLGPIVAAALDRIDRVFQSDGD